MLDQRISGQRPDYIYARLRRALEGRRKGRKGSPVRTGEGDTGGLDECARRRSAHPGDDPVALVPRRALWRFDGDPAGFDQVGVGFGKDVDSPGVACRHHPVNVWLLGSGEVGTAIEQGDRIVLARVGDQAHGVLNAGITAANDKNMLVGVLTGIVELVLDVRQVAAVAPHQVRVSLCADGQNDIFGLNRVAFFQFDREGTLFACDRLDVGIELNLDAGG